MYDLYSHDLILSIDSDISSTMEVMLISHGLTHQSLACKDGLSHMKVRFKFLGVLRGTFEMFVDSPYYLLQVGTFCGGALLATLHPLLENVLQTVDYFEISCLGAPFSWLEKPRNRMGRDLDCKADILMVFR
jgi:hypothetical protein